MTTGTEEIVARLREHIRSYRWQQENAGPGGSMWLLNPYGADVEQYIRDVETAIAELEKPLLVRNVYP